MPRYYVFATQAQAEACVDRINARARTIYAAQGYAVDAVTGAVTGKRASDGALMPNAVKTSTWDVPRQRWDGKWVVRHAETCPGNAFVIDVAGTTVGQFVGQDAVTTTVETEAPSWWPAPATTGARI